MKGREFTRAQRAATARKERMEKIIPAIDAAASVTLRPTGFLRIVTKTIRAPTSEEAATMTPEQIDALQRAALRGDIGHELQMQMIQPAPPGAPMVLGAWVPVPVMTEIDVERDAAAARERAAAASAASGLLLPAGIRR